MEKEHHVSEVNKEAVFYSYVRFSRNQANPPFITIFFSGNTSIFHQRVTEVLIITHHTTSMNPLNFAKIKSIWVKKLGDSWK